MRGLCHPQIHTLKACMQHMLNVSVWGLWRGDSGTKRSREWAFSRMTGVPWGQERRVQACVEGWPSRDSGWKQPSTWQGRPQEELAWPHLTSSLSFTESWEDTFLSSALPRLWYVTAAPTNPGELWSEQSACPHGPLSWGLRRGPAAQPPKCEAGLQLFAQTRPRRWLQLGPVPQLSHPCDSGLKSSQNTSPPPRRFWQRPLHFTGQGTRGLLAPCPPPPPKASHPWGQRA